MNLVERARNIALTPRSEWEVIAPESTSVGELYKGYIVPLSAIGPIASFIGLTIFGVSIPFLGTHRVSILSGLSSAVLSFVLGLVSVYVVALIIDALAPNFGGKKNPMQALKVAAYAFTPAWVVSVLHVIPALGMLVLLAGLYSIYVLYLGLPVLMQAPREKAGAYTAVVGICAIVVFVIIGTLASTFTHFGGGPGPLGVVEHSRGVTDVERQAAARNAALRGFSPEVRAAAEKVQAAAASGDQAAQMAAAIEAARSLNLIKEAETK